MAYREKPTNEEIAESIPPKPLEWKDVRRYVALVIVSIAFESLIGGLGAVTGHLLGHPWWGALIANAIVAAGGLLMWAAAVLEEQR